jgi:CMP-N,N'-diacetyllegionaminic acid synthase
LKIVSLILARGGSKEIPNKNIIDINGFPLIYYTIKSSVDSIVNETWVSTDSKIIKNISLSYRVKVIDRPTDIAQDNSQSEESLLHFSKYVDFDYLVFIQPTSPLLVSKDINKALTMVDNYDSIFSVYKEHWVPRWSKTAKPIDWNINQRPMRQQKEARFVENGAFYITSKENLLKSGMRYSGRIGLYEMPLSRSFQIDTENDLELVKKIISN